jgi:toxin YoeB
MKYTIEYAKEFTEHLDLHKKSGNLILIRKIDSFLDELENHPRTGTGKPERLKHYQGEVWSRRIDDHHRLVYEIREQELIVIAIAAYGHYGNK